MKTLISFIVVILTSTAFANHEETAFRCVSGTTAGDVVSIEGCVSAAGDHLIACDPQTNAAAYVTITKEYWAGIPQQTPPVIEVLHIPSHYFHFSWYPNQFALTMDHAKHGYINFKYVSNDYKGINQEFVLDTKSIDNSFKVIGCTFTAIPL